MENEIPKEYANDMQRIAKIVTREMGTSIEACSSLCRKAELAMSRYITYHIINEVYGYRIPLRILGQIFCNHGHANVINGINRVNKLLDVDKKFKQLYDNIFAIYNNTDAYKILKPDKEDRECLQLLIAKYGRYNLTRMIKELEIQTLSKESIRSYNLSEGYRMYIEGIKPANTTQKVSITSKNRE